jgi:hypothetical protein
MRAIIYAGLLAFVGLSVTQNANSSEDDSCTKAIKYANSYASDNDLSSVIGAQWKLVSSDKANDIEKLSGLIVFVAYQRAAYNWSDVIEKYGDAEGFHKFMYTACNEMVTNYDVVKRSSVSPANQTYDEIY